MMPIIDNRDAETDEIISGDLYEDEIDGGPKRHGCFLKLVAVLILAAFTAFSIPQFSYLFSDRLGFLNENQILKEDQIVQKCKPAIVSIEAVSRDEPLRNAVHRGTGFNISPTGTIITNQHVIANAGTITITFNDGTRYYTNRYEAIPEADIAIIKIAADNLPSLVLDTKNKVKSGDIVTIIGNPLGFEKVAQRGEVGEYHKIENNQSPVFDINLQINPGNSGSPVINGQAQVVGVVFASTAADVNGQTESRALAIPLYTLPLPQIQ